jgi:hypothetical protein
VSERLNARVRRIILDLNAAENVVERVSRAEIDGVRGRFRAGRNIEILLAIRAREIAFDTDVAADVVNARDFKTVETEAVVKEIPRAVAESLSLPVSTCWFEKPTKNSLFL